MKKFLSTLIILIVLLLPVNANPIDSVRLEEDLMKWDGTEYIVDKDIIRLGWDQGEGETSLFYKVKAVWIDPSDAYEYDINDNVTELYIDIQRPRTGHFKFLVCACDADGCSNWVESIDPNYATVDGEPRGWKVFWRLPPPEDPVISYMKIIKNYFVRYVKLMIN